MHPSSDTTALSHFDTKLTSGVYTWVLWLVSLCLFSTLNYTRTCGDAAINNTTAFILISFQLILSCDFCKKKKTSLARPARVKGHGICGGNLESRAPLLTPSHTHTPRWEFGYVVATKSRAVPRHQQVSKLQGQNSGHTPEGLMRHLRKMTEACLKHSA